MREKTNSNNYIVSDRSDSEASVCFWQRDDHREFITDPFGDVVNLARLTAYAEHGKEILDKQTHHEIPIAKPNAPEFLKPVSSDEHWDIHGSEPTQIDGIPRLREADSE